MTKENNFLENIDETQIEDDQKALLEKYVIKGYDIIYDEKEAIINLASRNDDTKVENVATAGFLVGQKIDSSEQQEGSPPFPDEIKIMGGYHLVDKLIQYAELKGVKPFSEEEKAASLQGTIQKYIEYGIKNRTIDPIALAKSVEQARPGAVKNALASIPDTPQGQPGTSQQQQQIPGAPGPAPGPAGAPRVSGSGAAPAGASGILNKPSPLEGLI